MLINNGHSLGLSFLRFGDRMNVPQVIEIKKIIEETPTIKTFIFDWTMVGENIPTPGQFVMVWDRIIIRIFVSFLEG